MAGLLNFMKKKPKPKEDTTTTTTNNNHNRATTGFLTSDDALMAAMRAAPPAAAITQEINVRPRTRESPGGTRDPREIIEGLTKPLEQAAKPMLDKKKTYQPPPSTTQLTNQSTSTKKYVPPPSATKLAVARNATLIDQAREATLADCPNHRQKNQGEASHHRVDNQGQQPHQQPQRQHYTPHQNHHQHPPRECAGHTRHLPPEPKPEPEPQPTPTPNSDHQVKVNKQESPVLDAPRVPARPPRIPRKDPANDRDPNAKFDDYYIRGRDLGSGAFAKVYMGVERATNDQYAVKQIDRSKMQWSGRDALQDEIQNLKKLRQAPHVVRYQDAFEEKQLCYLVLELLPGGELFAFIIQKGVFSEAEAKESCRCILTALDYMHQRRMVHRDLKPENLLLADVIDTGQVKVSDFGFSKTIRKKNECRTLCGTPGYLAPEVLERWPAYDVKCDTWSFGVILFLLLGGYLPFDSHGSNDVNQVFERTRNGEYHFYPQRWKVISSFAKDLVARCLTVNPRKRIDAKGALGHEWMTDLQAPKTQISVASLAGTVKAAERAKKDKRHQRATNNKVQELNDDFTVYLDTRKATDSILSKATGAGKTVASSATQFKEDGPSGRPFAHFYRKGESLGKGGFATVHRCAHKRTGVSYAIKEVDTSKLNEAEAATLQDEITALKFLRGAPYIIRLYDVFRESNTTYLVLEEMKGGDLLHRICDKEVYTEMEARDLCKILFHAVDYCHKKRIAHRDIKLDNLLLLEEGNDASIKLADFGFSKKVARKNGLTTLCGTPNYMAPEIFILQAKGYDYRCDMWSVGVVVYCLLGGYLPFEGTLEELAGLVGRGDYHFHEEYWKSVTSPAKNMISCLLQTNPDERYSAEEALACKWMGLGDEELNLVDLSLTQSKIRELSTGKEKVKHAVKAIMGANKWQSVAHIASGNQKLKPITLSVDDEEEAKFQDIYDIGDEIGDGIFSKIHLAIHKKSREELAVKKVIRKDLHPSDVAALNDEISVMKLLRECPQVVRLQEVFEDPDLTFMLLEHVKGDVLIDRLIQNQKYTEFDAKELVRNLLLAVAYCHTRRIANRNLKLENLVLPVGTTTEIRIMDFEFAKKVTFPNSLHTQCGTQEYVAPEVLENRPAYDVACDIWTVGVIVFIMLGGYYPFRGKSEQEILKNVRYGVFEFHPRYWKGVSEDARALIRKMLTVDPQQRVTADDALASAWIKANNSVLSADLKDSMQSKLREELKSKFKGAVQTVLATKKLQTIGEGL